MAFNPTWATFTFPGINAGIIQSFNNGWPAHPNELANLPRTEMLNRVHDHYILCFDWLSAVIHYLTSIILNIIYKRIYQSFNKLSSFILHNRSRPNVYYHTLEVNPGQL
jgi:hypothetical protein